MGQDVKGPDVRPPAGPVAKKPNGRAGEGGEAAARGPKPIVVKKYANRRLYHTGTSTYVTLEDLAVMVKRGEDFTVSDAKSGDDITRSVLAQIIFEQEAKEGQTLLPTTVLRQLIRFYGDQMQSLVPSYLEFSMTRLADEQQKFRDQMSRALGGDVFGVMQEQARANMAMFQEAFRLFTPFKPTAKPPEKPAEKPGESEEIEALKRELDAMRQRLDRMGR
jgi:polyhydroxyalkanoate synthesis repressor PhaR